MSKSVLIVGAKGMLGQELVRAFGDCADCVVTAWDREDIDVTNATEAKGKIAELWPDVIINAAAYNAVDAAEEGDKEYAKARALNVDAPETLAQIAVSLQARLVHYSTDYVFDGERPTYVGGGAAPSCCGQKCAGCQYHGAEESLDYFAYQEGDQPRPLSRYGQTKYEGEQAVAENASDYYIIRLSKLFGRPATSTAGKRAFFDVMLELGGKNEEVKAVDGEMSCFTYAPDLAVATKELVLSGEKSGIYHITNSGACTWYDGVVELYKLAGFDTKIIPVTPETFPRPATRPGSSVLLNTKLKSLRPWQEALAEHIG